MKPENLLYLLDTLDSTTADDVDGDGFDVVWEDENGFEYWSEESITAVAGEAAAQLRNMASAYEFLAAEYGKILHQAGFSESALAGQQDAMGWIAKRPSVDEAAE